MPQSSEGAQDQVRYSSGPRAPDELPNAVRGAGAVLCCKVFRLLQVGSLTRSDEIRRESARRAEHITEQVLDLINNARLLRCAIELLVKGDSFADQLKPWCDDADAMIKKIHDRVFKQLKPLRNGQLTDTQKEKSCNALMEVYEDCNARLAEIATRAATWSTHSP